MRATPLSCDVRQRLGGPLLAGLSLSLTQYGDALALHLPLAHTPPTPVCLPLRLRVQRQCLGISVEVERQVCWRVCRRCRFRSESGQSSPTPTCSFASTSLSPLVRLRVAHKLLAVVQAAAHGQPLVSVHPSMITRSRCPSLSISTDPNKPTPAPKAQPRANALEAPNASTGNMRRWPRTCGRASAHASAHALAPTGSCSCCSQTPTSSACAYNKQGAAGAVELGWRRSARRRGAGLASRPRCAAWHRLWRKVLSPSPTPEPGHPTIASITTKIADDEFVASSDLYPPCFEALVLRVGV